MKNLKYGKQFIDSDDIKSVVKALKSELITTGPLVEIYEKKIKNFLKCKNVSVVNSGTAGLDLAMRSIDLKGNDNVILPANNFVSSLNVCENLKAKIFLADVDSFTGQVTPETINKCIKDHKLKKVKAIVTMYLGGHPLQIDEFYKLKLKLKCFLIEDACHAFGSSYCIKQKKYMIGSCAHSDICVFSTHPIKSFTTGEGGIVTSRSNKIIDKIRNLKNHGIFKNKLQLKKKGSWYYNVINTGFNYRISDINCALGISQLKKINKFLKKRNDLSKLYYKHLNNYSNKIKILKFISKNLFSSNHLLVANISFGKDKNLKKKLFNYLNKKKIFPQVNYIPLYKFKRYNHLKPKDYYFLGAESYYNNSLSLPIHYSMSQKDVIRVCKELKNFIDKFVK